MWKLFAVLSAVEAVALVIMIVVRLTRKAEDARNEGAAEERERERRKVEIKESLETGNQCDDVCAGLDLLRNDGKNR